MYESRKEHSLRKINTFLLLLALQKAMNFTILTDIILDSITTQLVFFSHVWNSGSKEHF